MKIRDGSYFSPEMEALYEAHQRDRRAGCLAGMIALGVVVGLGVAVFVLAAVASLGWHVWR